MTTTHMREEKEQKEANAKTVTSEVTSAVTTK